MRADEDQSPRKNIDPCHLAGLAEKESRAGKMGRQMKGKVRKRKSSYSPSKQISIRRKKSDPGGQCKNMEGKE